MARATKQLRILVADDHEIIRRGIWGLFRARRGWTIVGEAADGVEAVAKAAKLKPDLVILDITMPNLDGLEATRQIRAAVPNTQVLILTLHESNHMVRRAMEAGALGYVLKSDLASHLVEAVKNVSQGKSYLTPKVSALVMEALFHLANQSKEMKRAQRQPTPREMQIIRLLAEGKSNKETAAALGIAVRTVESHRANIWAKLGLHSLAELIHYAIRQGITVPQGPRV